MGKIEQAVKSEIVRLAEKEIRAVCVPLAREVRELRRQVSRLSKMVAPLVKLRAELQAERVAQKAKLEAAPAEVKAARLSPLLVKKLRERLGLTQSQLASLVGVSSASVTFWERGRSRPQGKNKEALVALRKVGRRDVKRMLAEKSAGAEQQTEKKVSTKVRRKAAKGKAKKGTRTAKAGQGQRQRRRR
ncbi:MAG: helix-turn-helix domain-containing protein [Candidatus Brocadiae bacterium]|nr:helix-turn-helix domain-containing protein [Candidatus Brocadiia bacterium]